MTVLLVAGLTVVGAVLLAVGLTVAAVAGIRATWSP